jgi:hypothetical protein
MSPVLTRPRPRSGPALVRRDLRVAVFAGALLITAIAGVHAALRGPDFVERVTVVNETPYLVDIEITNDSRDAWLKLGPVEPRARHTFGNVVDQGGHWVFHVTTGQYDGGEFSLRRAELDRTQWRVTIPEDVRERLESGGAFPLE